MHGRDLPEFDGERWLADLVDYAVGAGACVRWACTTCGNIAFRKALIQSAEIAAGSKTDQKILCEIARQLGRAPVRFEQIETTRFVIMFLYAQTLPFLFKEKLLPLFAGSPAEAVYHGMVEHYEKALARASAHDLRNDPKEIERRKQQRESEKQKTMAERANRKQEIDRSWRERARQPAVQGKGDR